MEASKLFVLILGIFIINSAFIFADDEESTDENDSGIHIEHGKPEPEVKEDNDVVILTKDSFDGIIDARENVLVEFYAPWCGHCKQLAPEYENAASKLKEEWPRVTLAKVDATVEPDLASRFEVSGYPTLKYFKNGVPMEFDAPRNTDGIVNECKKLADPNYKPPAEAVIALTTETFDAFVEEEELTMVEFYAPWCGHCKKLAPEYEKAAKALKDTTPPIPLAKVDCTVEKDLAEKYGVSGYPTIKVFRKGRAYDYKGDQRSSYGIIDFMEKQRGPPSKEVSDMKTLKPAFLENDITVVGFFQDSGSNSMLVFEEFANNHREDYEMFHSFDQSLRDEYKVNAGSVVVIKPEKFHTKYDTKYDVLEMKEETVAEDVVSFLKAHNVPLVGHYNTELKDKRYADRRPLALFFYTVDFTFAHRKATEMWRQKIANIANNYRDITFAIVDDDEEAQLFQQMGLDESGEEMNVGILGPKDSKFPMLPAMEEFDSEEIIDYLNRFKKGEVKQRMKSMPVPKKQKGSVTAVVGTTFEKIVLDNKKDVLIELYAPWCGHCKKFEPEYNKLAKKLKKDKNLLLAKMDATANDAPPAYPASGFPTIYFAPANSKNNPVKYEGDRDLDDLEKFMKTNAVVSFGKNKKDEL